jgi:FkbM family methyltransferase
VRNAIEVATNQRGERRPIARDYVYRAVAPLVPSFEIQSGDARFVLNTDDKEVSRILFCRGEYDRPLLTLVHDLLGRLGDQPFSLADRVFLDIGANLGSATVEATVHFGAAGGVAFEPDPVNFSFLERNLAANGLLDRVDAHRLALSDRTGSVSFELSPDNAGDHRVRLDAPRATELGEADRQVVEVEATTLDALCDAGTVELGRVGLAWIDVQGHEPNMLAGAEQLTASGVPVVVEYSPYHLRAGGGLDRFEAIVTEHYTHVLDTDRAGEGIEAALIPVTRLGEIRARLGAPHEHTDLILLKR